MCASQRNAQICVFTEKSMVALPSMQWIRIYAMHYMITVVSRLDWVIVAMSLHVHKPGYGAKKNWKKKKKKKNKVDNRICSQIIGYACQFWYKGQKEAKRLFTKLHKHSLHCLSTPWVRNWGYFCSTGSHFRDMGRFSKLPYFSIKLGNCQKFQTLHIYSFSTSWGQNWAYFRSTGSRILSFYPMGRNWA